MPFRTVPLPPGTPEDPASQAMVQEPRSLVIPAEKPSGAQNVGLAVASIPARLIGGDGIRVDAEGFGYSVNIDIAELSIAQGQPNEQWLPVWIEGTGADEIRRVAVNAIPADAEHDGVVYGRQDGAWVPAIENITIEWDDIQNVPATFPPTLPIAQSGVTNLVPDLDAIESKNTEQDGRLTSIENKNVTQDGRITQNETDIAANAAAINNNAVAIATKMPKPATTPAQNWVAKSDGTWAADPIQDNPPNDGQQYARKGDSTWVKVTGGVYLSDTPPAGAPDSALWVESDSGALFVRWNDGNSTQWVMLNAAGMPEAPKDGGAYVRYNGSWYNINVTFGNYLPLTGGTLTGGLQVNAAGGIAIASGGSLSISGGGVFQITRNVASGYAVIGYNNLAGGAIYGDNNGTYGILGYSGGYSLYGNGAIYVSGGVTAGGYFTSPYGMQVSANYILGYSGGGTWTIPSGALFEFAFSGTTRFRIEPTILRNLVDNTMALGTGSYRYTTVYATTGTINTSDEREKTDIRPLEERELAVARALKPLICAYRWKDRVDEKGADARIHFGVIAQRVMEAFFAEGLNATDYGLFCVDPKVIYHPAVRDENGTVVEAEWEEPDGMRYGVRYDELAMFILAGL